MAGDVVVGKAVELGFGGGDFLQPILDVAAEGEGERGDLVLEGADLLAGGLVFVDAGEAVLKQGAVEVVAGGGIGAF